MWTGRDPDPLAGMLAPGPETTPRLRRHTLRTKGGEQKPSLGQKIGAPAHLYDLLESRDGLVDLSAFGFPGDIFDERLGPARAFFRRALPLRKASLSPKDP